MDHFRSQGVTSGIWQCQLRLLKEHAVYAHTGLMCLCDLNVDQIQVNLIKKQTKGGF